MIFQDKTQAKFFLLNWAPAIWSVVSYLVRLETQPEGVAGEEDHDDEDQDQHGLLVALHVGIRGACSWGFLDRYKVS